MIHSYCFYKLFFQDLVEIITGDTFESIKEYVSSWLENTERESEATG